MKFRIVMLAALSLCLAVFLAIPLCAQLPDSGQAAQIPGQASDLVTDNISQVAQKLNLSPEQQSQLAPILASESPKVKQIMKDPNLSSSQKTEQVKGVYSQTDSSAKSILDPSQYKQWMGMRKTDLANIPNMK